MWKKTKQISAWVLAGLIIAFILLELTLRLIGDIHQQRQMADMLGGDGKMVVLALGDSFTTGVGGANLRDK